MKSRYNLRCQSTKPIASSRKKISSTRVIKKKSKANPTETRRHSLRLTPVNKNSKSISETILKWRRVEIESDETSSNASTDNNDDDFDELLVRHQRLMLEEQKDRKLYERYIRDQRTLRRLQCRRSHTAHLKESTRNRLLRELERERRETIHEKICSYLANRTMIFRHGSIKKSMNWTTLEEEMPLNRNIGTIRELDVMIENLKKGMRNSSALTSKPRLSHRERQNQRLTTTTTNSTKSDNSSTIDLPSSSSTSSTSTLSSSHSLSNLPSPLPIIAYSPRVPLVRFIDDPNTKLRINNSQQLTCIQNVLSARKSFLRSKSNHLESSPNKKRAIEKENFSLNTSPMVSIKTSSSFSSIRTYPNTRKHLMITNSLITRRQTRLSTNV